LHVVLQVGSEQARKLFDEHVLQLAAKRAEKRKSRGESRERSRSRKRSRSRSQTHKKSRKEKDKSKEGDKSKHKYKSKVRDADVRMDQSNGGAAAAKQGADTDGVPETNSEDASTLGSGEAATPVKGEPAKRHKEQDAAAPGGDVAAPRAGSEPGDTS